MNKLNGKITKSAAMRGALTRGGGGGTYVEANPEGVATELLEKILIEDIIYNIRNLPSDSAADNGDVLTMGTNGAEWAPLPESGITYSTDEQKIGTWIDGKKLYQKTFITNNILIGSSWNYRVLGTIGISIINVNGYYDLIIKNTTSHQRPLINFYDSANYNCKTLIDNDGEDLSIQINANAHDFNVGYITIQYTKVGE